MPDLDAFEAEVKENIKQLLAKDATTRRKAAQWLGEAGEPSAITALAQAYKSDSDPHVRQAAAYSLGMFRKLEQELNGEHADEVMKLLEDVADGHMGGRPRIPTRTVVKVELALLLSAILVAVLAFVLPPILRGSGGTSAPPPQTVNETPLPPEVGDKDRAVIVSELRAAYHVLNANTAKLQAQYQGRLGGGALDCTVAFDTLTPFVLSANNTQEFPDLVEIANTINQGQTDFAAAKTTFDQVCVEGQTLDASVFGAPMAQVVGLLQTLSNTDAAITAVEGSENAIVNTPLPAVETPTQEVIATVAPAADIHPHVAALQNIIDEVMAARGAYSLLNQYWNEAKTAGVTDGCRESQPSIPSSYSLPEEFTSNQTLKLTADLVNTGLQALRDGWSEFATACTSGTAGASADAGLIRVGGAKTAFDTAAAQLVNLRG